jgi:hypothetical protein
MTPNPKCHLTEACRHDEGHYAQDGRSTVREYCQHCEEGCAICGALESWTEQNDLGVCPACAAR